MFHCFYSFYWYFRNCWMLKTIFLETWWFNNFYCHARYYYTSQTRFNVIFFSGILEKNRDTFNADLNDLIGKSKCKFLLHLFEKELKMVCFPNFTFFRWIYFLYLKLFYIIIFDRKSSRYNDLNSLFQRKTLFWRRFNVFWTLWASDGRWNNVVCLLRLLVTVGYIGLKN